VPSGTDFTVRVPAGLLPVFPVPSPLDYDLTVTVGLIGCAIEPGAAPWEDDLVLCQLTTAGSVNHTSVATLTPWDVSRYAGPGSDADVVESHQILGGGAVANFIFPGIPYALLGSPEGQDWDFRFPSWGDAGARLRIGGFFLGFDVPLRVHPDGFTWSTDVLNPRFTSRAYGNISGDGVIHRVASFDAVNIPIGDITGKDALFGTTFPATYRANLFRCVIASLGQPMLLNPYPHMIDSHLDEPSDDPEAVALSNMQNFFSIYGLLDRRLDLRQIAGPGLKTTFNARINVTEYR
jgi:hypothetical protein